MCNDNGSAGASCSSTGVCSCLTGYVGDKCDPTTDNCLDGYYPDFNEKTCNGKSFMINII